MAKYAIANEWVAGGIVHYADGTAQHGFTFTTRRSSMAFCTGPIPETFKCYVCGADSPAGHDLRAGNPSVCPDHCEDHEYEPGEIECTKCGAERPFDDEPDYWFSY